MEEIKTKRCPKCERVLPITQFSKDKSKKDGLRSYCKECDRAKSKKYHITHRDSELKRFAEWRAKNPTYNAEYYQANKDKIAEYQAEYYQANKDKIAEYRDPILSPLGWANHIVAQYRRMDRERGFDDSKTITAEWFLQNIMYKPCAHCGLLQVGAIGANRLNNNIGHEASNLEPCCSSCNSRENIRDMIERGLAWFQKGKKQSFSSFVKEHKKD